MKSIDQIKTPAAIRNLQKAAQAATKVAEAGSIKLRKIEDGPGYGEKVLGTWEVLEDGVLIGKMEKRTRTVGVCGRGVNYITRYRKETTYHFKPLKGTEIRFYVGTNAQAIEEIKNWSNWMAALVK